jgi:hypothetical protein
MQRIWTSTSYYRAYHPVRGQTQHRQRGIATVYLVEQRYAVHTTHLQVGNHQVRLQHRNLPQRLLGALHRRHRIAGCRQSHRQQS